MDSNETKLYIRRIELFVKRITNRVLTDSVKLDAEFCNCPDPVPFSSRLDCKFSAINEGDQWGKAWESGWFKLNGNVPNEWTGSKVVLQLDFDGEGLVLDDNGKIIQGISNGSVFDYDFNRDIVHLFDKVNGGEKIRFWVEAAANGLFGVFTEPDPLEKSHNRYGHYDAKVKKMRLCKFDSKHWHLWLDLRILFGLVKTLPEKSVRRARLIKNINAAIDIYADSIGNVDKFREYIEKDLAMHAEDSALNVTAVGHAHIDTAWLWPVSETVRKCARTFASQLKLMDEYPEYVFGASQPQHYQFVKDNYPELYKRIKQKVEEGRWELQGGMWVEADCNIISGESMVRQILHGKNFFLDEFNVDVDNLWLPDVFGYSAALPQILQKSGINYFLTQKMSWSQFNEFPHHTFMWRGIDGSEVLTHFPPENTYNSQLGTDYLVPAVENFKERDFVDDFISLYGVGDGGGGPKEENIELGRRMADLEGSPKLMFGRADDFFKKLEKYRHDLKKWVGELYLELHRGTLTTQAKVKKLNRKLENELTVIEKLYSMLPLNDYPVKQLDELWKKVLLNQFHDIIPGSSITKVYDVTHKEYEESVAMCDKLIDGVTSLAFEKDDNSITVFNPLSYDYDRAVVIKESDSNYYFTDTDGNRLLSQCENGRHVVLVSIPSLSFMTIIKVAGEAGTVTTSDEMVLENDFVRYEFDTNGRIKSAYDKIVKKELITTDGLGNKITLYEDRPNDWDAWDVDKFYEDAVVGLASASKPAVKKAGDIRQILEVELIVGDSVIHQKIILDKNSKRLDIETEVDWREKHKMLRVSFDTAIKAEQASFDIQYGYVKRPTHRNTSWDTARFESAAHRYVDLSDNDYGVALLNDSKYGHKVLDNVIDLNLLRSPSYPDPDADIGMHSFIYSFYPHENDLIRSDVIKQSAMLNQQVLAFNGFRSKDDTYPYRVIGDGLSLEVVKKAEKEDVVIVRVVETLGCRSTGELLVSMDDITIHETDLMERESVSLIDSAQPVILSLKPFEIKTYKIIENKEA